jgi:hypothetical protein
VDVRSEHLPVVSWIGVRNIEEIIDSLLAGGGKMFQTLFTKQILHSFLGVISKLEQLMI